MATVLVIAAVLCLGTTRAEAAAGGPVATLAPSAFDFGSVQVGEVGDVVDATLTNTGGGSLALSRFGIASSSANPGDFWVAPGGSCSTSVALAGGESCTIRVRFNPVAAGSRSGLLSVWVNTAAARVNVALTGLALAAPQPVLAPAAVDFGSVQVGQVSAVADVTLSNTGGGTLSFWRFGIASSSANPGDFWVAPGGSCSTSLLLAPGDSCTVRVRFNPVASGSRSGLLSFWVNTRAGRIDAALTGQALDAPQPVLAPDTIDFGSVPPGQVSAVTDVTLSNTGGGTLSFWRFGIAASSADPSDFWVAPGGTCSTSVSLAPGESCTVRVRFNPLGVGDFSAKLSFWVNTPAGRIDAALSGRVDDPCAGGCL